MEAAGAPQLRRDRNWEVTSPLWACGQIRVQDSRTPSFSPGTTGRKTPPIPVALALLFTRLSSSPGFLEIPAKPGSASAPAITAHAPFACLRRRLRLLGGTVAVLGDGEVRKTELGSFSSLRARERSMDSPCYFPGPAHASPSSLSSCRAWVPAGGRVPVGRARPKKPDKIVNKFPSLPLQKALPASGWTNKHQSLSAKASGRGINQVVWRVAAI